jgi:FtsP/CotA-like multicopper oxidase with cupredoxin domain
MLSDRAFNTDGSIHFTTVGDNPDTHPYWDPEYFGDQIMVNGKVWPNMNVKRQQYRFRIVDGSNARFYNLSFSNGMSFTQIGGDGSYLPKPVTMTSVFLAICERADILVDFSQFKPGTKIVLQNSANAPFPGGDAPDANTSVVMQFTVQNTPAVHPKPLPSTLITIPTLTETPGIGNPKIFTLNEQEHPVTGDPVSVLIDGRHFDEEVTELPRVGTTETWYIQNLTEDAHPIHVHLVEFQLESRQVIERDRFKAYWESLNGATLPLDHPPIRVNVETAIDTGDGTGKRDFLFDQDTGQPTDPIPPAPNESGWKDVFIAPPFMVTRLTIRLAPQSVPEPNPNLAGKNTFPFDPTKGPGYVWHCHILDHEDNDMMRPMAIVNNDRPSLNSETASLSPKSKVASGSSTPAANKPAHHNHNGAKTKRATPVAGRPTPAAAVRSEPVAVRPTPAPVRSEPVAVRPTPVADGEG